MNGAWYSPGNTPGAMLSCFPPLSPLSKQQAVAPRLSPCRLLKKANGLSLPSSPSLKPPQMTALPLLSTSWQPHHPAFQWPDAHSWQAQAVFPLHTILPAPVPSSCYLCRQLYQSGLPYVHRKACCTCNATLQSQAWQRAVAAAVRGLLFPCSITQRPALAHQTSPANRRQLACWAGCFQAVQDRGECKLWPSVGQPCVPVHFCQSPRQVGDTERTKAS